MSKRVKRKPVGRPPGQRPVIAMRIHPDLHEQLVQSAADQKIPLAEDAANRLRQSFDIDKLLEEAKTARNAERIQAIREAGCQIVRDAGGNVTVNVSPELLLAEADGILRSGFVAKEEVGKSMVEIAAERSAERV